MDEKQLHRNLIRMTMLIVLVSIVIVMIGSSVNTYIQKAQRSTAETELKSSTEVYKIQIERQIVSNLQMLNTMAGFINIHNFSDENLFLEGVEQLKEKNRFVSVSLVQNDDQVLQTLLDRKTRIKLNVTDLSSEAQKIVEESRKGKEGVSNIFYDEKTGEQVIAFSVPVLENNDVQGVLLVYDSIEEFEGIIDLATQLRQKGQLIIHMINQRGDFLIRSNNRMSDEETDSIYHMKLRLLDEEAVRETLDNKKQYYVTFSFDNIEYQVFFTPLNYNDWYLFCIMPTVSNSDATSKILITTRLMFLLVIILFTILVFYGYRLFKRNMDILIQLAYFDTLTQLYNATKFRKVCTDTLKNGENYQICILNIRRFQFINELLGEADADELLCYIADTIRKYMKKGEYFCHDNADQFLLLVKERDSNEIISLIKNIEKELVSFSERYKQKYEISLYAGISRKNGKERGEDSYNRLLQSALVALKEARSNMSTVVFYDEQLYKVTQMKNQIENWMRKALEEKEFYLFLQPKMDLKTGTLSGAEALVRWIRQDETMIYPDQFIPLFEENGFCVELDLYMVEAVCKQLREWIEEGKAIVPISINQSKLLFYCSDYIEKICAITNKYKIDPSYIILEILEGLAIENLELLNGTIQQLHEKGFRVSLDDFGSGYSSLNVLGRLKIDELKIDRMFLLGIDELDIEERESQKNIMKHIVSLAKSMEIDTVIEGVETKENEILMKAMECDYGQGYYYCRPIAADDFAKRYL